MTTTTPSTAHPNAAPSRGTLHGIGRLLLRLGVPKPSDGCTPTARTATAVHPTARAATSVDLPEHIRMTIAALPGALDVTAVHEHFAPADVLRAERRALYRMAAGLLVPDVDHAVLTDDELDGPLLLHHIGEALAGRAALLPSDLVAARRPVAVVPLRSGAVQLNVVSDPRAAESLAPALRLIGSQVTPRAPELELLTESDGESFCDALRLTRDGLELANKISPRLTDDLVVHASLLAVLDPESSGRLVSASSRFFPGLVLIDRPASALDVAEALIHECAHQKFFDLATTRSIFGAGQEPSDGFRPSWSTSVWQTEQALAACHAYACLAQFGVDAGPGLIDLAGDSSLLPVARMRSLEIGRWLLGRQSELEPDGRWMLGSLLGRPTDVASPSPGHPQIDGGHFCVDPHVRIDRMNGTVRLLAGRPGPPTEFFWLDGAAAAVASRLGATAGGMPFDVLVSELSACWTVDRREAWQRVSTALAQMLSCSIVMPLPAGGSVL
jgi:hypothetical protein